MKKTITAILTLSSVLINAQTTPATSNAQYQIPNLTSQLPNPKPQINIQSITINQKNQPLPAKDTPLQLTPEQNTLQIIFQTNNQPDSVQYQLKYLDATPIFSQYPIARYTNLPGNEYEFNYCSYKNNVKSPTNTFKISKRRSLTEEWWFWPSMVFYIALLAAAIVYFWQMYNFRQRMKLQNIRHQIAADLHDEVGSTLGSIAIFTKLLRKNFAQLAPESLPILDKILSSSQETIENLRDTVWAINPTNDDFNTLIEKMRSFSHQILTAKEINVQFHNTFDENPHLSKNLKISMEQRRNAYLMFKEAIHNIVKHTEAKNTTITIQKDRDGVVLTIQDNGKGFDPTQTHEGNGLKNFHKRATECFIQLTIDSKPTIGTTIKMLIPEL